MLLNVFLLLKLIFLMSALSVETYQKDGCRRYSKTEESSLKMMIALSVIMSNLL